MRKTTYIEKSIGNNFKRFCQNKMLLKLFFSTSQDHDISLFDKPKYLMINFQNMKKQAKLLNDRYDMLLKILMIHKA